MRFLPASIPFFPCRTFLTVGLSYIHNCNVLFDVILHRCCSSFSITGPSPMHAYTRLPSGQLNLSCPSPPLSPRLSSPKLRHGRTKGGRGSNIATAPLHQTFWQRFACFLLSVLLRRHWFFLIAPLIYISGMLVYMGTTSFDVPKITNATPPGSIYRSPEVFKRLWPAMQKANTSYGIMAAWQVQKGRELWKPCIQPSSLSKGLQESNGFIIIEANGGLNQQRSSICNAVALAGLLNATLVTPTFHLNSVWQDSSLFGDIYDEEHFINSLAGYVRVVRELPEYISEELRNNVSLIHNFRIKAWQPASFYLSTVLPKLRKLGVIRISPFANRLSYDKVPPKLQQLRCIANFQALRFAKPIADMGEKLVDRMIKHSNGTSGKYIAVHLRFEEDMVAFSCCTYDGGEEEKRELDAARERGWRGKFNKTGRIIRPGVIRMDGRCPLTPLEVGMMLRGMGFQNNTPIFLAAGKIYKAEKNMIPLLQMFPMLQTKETLLSSEELEPFKNYSSRLAALDYTVCLHSEVFVTTQGGNFPQFLIGQRRYLNKGHSKTIKPDKRKLAILLDNPKIRWETFTKQMQAMRRHSDLKGHELRKSSSSVYTYPAPDCMCPYREDVSNSLSNSTGSFDEILSVM
ncbi:hypothetical protein KP509_09G012400 [Ceratopteris richardii]|uniref:O-fucosyltransferase family protein n=2 Tax=Ceratopteris richardii TaxID=49495 RepID=A0A8T2U5E8_CERRI|nr:hypothetical protein KP509_09G012400 [Ceratopteris richardii]